MPRFWGFMVNINQHLLQCQRRVEREGLAADRTLSQEDLSIVSKLSCRRLRRGLLNVRCTPYESRGRPTDIGHKANLDIRCKHC